jgi:hypothetical protein
MARRSGLAALLAVAMLCAPGLAAQAPRAIDLLDRYLRGDFDAVVADFEKHTTFGWLLEQLEAEGPGWIGAGGPAARERRELAAATLALEAARVGQWTAWKHREEYPGPDPTFRWVDQNGRRYVPETLVWEPPARLVEWGCTLLREDDRAPSPRERLWQLAALAVAQRSEDGEFLFSEQLNTRLSNPKAEIDHLVHVMPRFPEEARFMLAVGTALEWQVPDRALKEFERLRDHPDVGGEARLRLGALQLRQGRHDRAVETLDEVERRTRDPWLLYLARSFRGQALERRNRAADAERAYRDALTIVPAAQSASMALASLLARTDRRTEAGEVVRQMLDRRPPAADPWRSYVHADDRFWPVLIARLRAEIRR